MTKSTGARRPITRRELARQALAGAAGALLSSTLVSRARAQVVDPLPAALPPLPAVTAPQNAPTMPTTPTTEGELLTRLVPVAAGYALSETQSKEVAAQLKDYPAGFSKARAYALADDTGPAFAADAPSRKERVQ